VVWVIAGSHHWCRFDINFGFVRTKTTFYNAEHFIATIHHNFSVRPASNTARSVMHHMSVAARSNSLNVTAVWGNNSMYSVLVTLMRAVQLFHRIRSFTNASNSLANGDLTWFNWSIYTEFNVGKNIIFAQLSFMSIFRKHRKHSIKVPLSN